MLSQGNCLNSPSGYSFAFIISDGFKITANILFPDYWGLRVLSVIHTNGPLKPLDTSGRGEEGCWEERRGAVFSVLYVQVCTGTVHVRKGKERRGNQCKERVKAGEEDFLNSMYTA